MTGCHKTINITGRYGLTLEIMISGFVSCHPLQIKSCVNIYWGKISAWTSPTLNVGLGLGLWVITVFRVRVSGG